MPEPDLTVRVTSPRVYRVLDDGRVSCFVGFDGAPDDRWWKFFTEADMPTSPGEWQLEESARSVSFLVARHEVATFLDALQKRVAAANDRYRRDWQRRSEDWTREVARREEAERQRQAAQQELDDLLGAG